MVRSQSTVEGSPRNRKEKPSSQLPARSITAVNDSFKVDESEQESTRSSKNSNKGDNKVIQAARCDANIEDYTEWGRDNPLIKTGYRVGYRGFMPILKTLLEYHNESVNVWSHLLGQIFFIGVLILVLINCPLMHKLGEQGLTEF